MKILITGGAGFIGYHLSKHLSDMGYEVVICDNFVRGNKDKDLIAILEKPNVNLIECDLTDPKSIEVLGGGYDYIYHLASINHTELFYKIPDEILRVGILTSMNILEWMKKYNRNGKIMFASSNEAYAGCLHSFNQLPIPTPEDVPLVISDPYNPRWSYAGTKLIGELLFINYARIYNLRMSIIRPHNFYGPRAGVGHVIPDFIDRILAKENPFNIYGGDDTRSFCYIDDAVYQMVAVMESSKTDGETIHLGNAEEILIKDLAKILFKLLDYHPEVVIHGSPKGSVSRRCPSLTKLRNLLGLKAKINIEEGLKNTLYWYAQR